jgi:hypothetical protein
MPGLSRSTTVDGCVRNTATTPSARLVFASVTSTAGGTVLANEMRSPGDARVITTATSAALSTVVASVTAIVTPQSAGPNPTAGARPAKSTTEVVTSSALTPALNACLMPDWRRNTIRATFTPSTWLSTSPAGVPSRRPTTSGISVSVTLCASPRISRCTGTDSHTVTTSASTHHGIGLPCGERWR